MPTSAGWWLEQSVEYYIVNLRKLGGDILKIKPLVVTSGTFRGNKLRLQK